MKRAVASLILLVGSVVGALPAAAQDSLVAGEIDSSSYPALEILVSLPGSVGNAASVENFSVLESADVIVPEVVPISSTKLDVVLAIDTSGSMAGNALDAAKSSALGFIDQLPATVRVAVVGFGPTPTLGVDLTDDRDALDEAVSSLRAGGETSLYDALAFSADQIGSESVNRSVLVVLSDGGDTVSATSLEDATAMVAARFDVVNAIVLSTTEQDTAALEAVTAGVGTVVLAEDPVALAGVYQDVADQILNQYLLRWDTKVASTHDVVVTYDDGVTVLTAAREATIDAGNVATTPATQPAAITDNPAPQVAQVLTIVPHPSTVPGWLLVAGIALIAGALFLAGLVTLIPKERTRSLASGLRRQIPRGRELTGLGSTTGLITRCSVVVCKRPRTSWWCSSTR